MSLELGFEEEKERDGIVGTLKAAIPRKRRDLRRQRQGGGQLLSASAWTAYAPHHPCPLLFPLLPHAAISKLSFEASAGLTSLYGFMSQAYKQPRRSESLVTN